MLSALAYVFMLFIHIPVGDFLTYDPKDVIIAVGGFILGPLASVAMSFTVSLAEMCTVSSTGIIGCVMNFLSSASFSATAALIYKKMHTVKGAVISLLCGTAVLTCTMLLWNYLITPIYQGVPREVVAAMLPTLFLPFNLAKGLLNTSVTLVFYKPIITALRRAGFVERSTGKAEPKIWIYALCAVLFCMGAFIVIAINKMAG